MYVVCGHVCDMWSCMWYVVMYVVCGHVCGMWSCMWYVMYVICGHVCDMWSCMWYVVMYVVCGHVCDMWVMYVVCGHVCDMWSCMWYVVMYVVTGHVCGMWSLGRFKSTFFSNNYQIHLKSPKIVNAYFAPRHALFLRHPYTARNAKNRFLTLILLTWNVVSRI